MRDSNEEHITAAALIVDSVQINRYDGLSFIEFARRSYLDGVLFHIEQVVNINAEIQAGDFALI